MSTYPELTSIKTNDYELKTIKEKMDLIEKQKKFDNQYNQFELILDELKKIKKNIKRKLLKIKNNKYSIKL